MRGGERRRFKELPLCISSSTSRDQGGGVVPAPACPRPRPHLPLKTKGSFQTGLMELVLGDSLVR